MSIISINCGGQLEGQGIEDESGAFSIAPFALYFLAQDLLDLYDAPEGKDIVGGYNLSKVGAPSKLAGYATTSRNNGYLAPFTGRQLADAAGVQTGMTVITVARCAANLQWAAWGTFSANGVVGETGLLHSGSRVRSLAALPYTENFIAPADANRGAHFAFYAHVVSKTRQDVYARHAGEASMVSAKKVVAMTEVGGANFMAVGHDPYNASWTDPGDLVLQAFFPGALSDVQIATLYEEIAELIAEIDIDI